MFASMFKLNVKKAISRKPRWLVLASYLEKWIPAPFFLLIHVTLGCKKACGFCYQVRDGFFKKHEGIIDLSDFEKILSQSSGFIYKPHIHLFGGEPLDHPEFTGLLNLCRQYQFRPSFTTNGKQLLKYADTVSHSSVNQINVSIGAVWHGGEFPTTILEAIKILHSRVRFNLNYAITKESAPSLLTTVEHCASLFKQGEVETFVCQHLAFERKDSDRARAIDAESLKRQLKFIKERRWPFDFLSLPEIAVEDIKSYYADWEYPFARKCCIPWLGLSVYPDLTVSPGGAIFSCTEIIGSLRDQTIRDIWHSPAMRTFRGRLRSGLPERCRRCCHHFYY